MASALTLSTPPLIVVVPVYVLAPLSETVPLVVLVKPLVPPSETLADPAFTWMVLELVNVPPDPGHVSLGMNVRLATFPIGTDDAGVEAIGFGYEPVG